MSGENYLLYVLDSLKSVGGLSYKKMMGEYLLYKDGILFGGVYDDRFLIKKTPSNEGADLTEELPYAGAKPMFATEPNDENAIKYVLNAINDLHSAKDKNYGIKRNKTAERENSLDREKSSAR